MGTTPKGFPYPEGTDFVVDGDDAIKALAEAIDERLPMATDASSAASAISVSNSTSGSAVVTFAAGRFDAPPQVIATAGSSFFNVSASNLSPTSVQLTVRHINATTSDLTIYVSWVAIQIGPAAAAQVLAAGATVTCPTPGCPNQGVAVQVSPTYVDEEGQEQTIGQFLCGPCGTDITSTLTEAA